MWNPNPSCWGCLQPYGNLIHFHLVCFTHLFYYHLKSSVLRKLLGLKAKQLQRPHSITPTYFYLRSPQQKEQHHSNNFTHSIQVVGTDKPIKINKNKSAFEIRKLIQNLPCPKLYLPLQARECVHNLSTELPKHLLISVANQVVQVKLKEELVCVFYKINYKKKVTTYIFLKYFFFAHIWRLHSKKINLPPRKCSQR